MKIFIKFLFILPINTFAKTIPEDFVLNAVYSEIYKRLEKLPEAKPAKPKQTSLNKGERGKMIVERLKAQARARIAKQKGLDPRKFKSGKDIAAGEKADNKKFIAHMTQVKKELESIKSRTLSPKEWSEDFNELKKQWDLKKLEYVKNIKLYQDNLIDTPLVLPVSKKEQKKKSQIKIEKEYFIVDGAFQVTIKDQKARPTCSAFTGIRAIEIMLAQKGKQWDLSEQYFYWASKPNCRKQNCSQKGAWVGHGYLYSKQNQSLDIPLEYDCKYVKFSQRNNETQIPLYTSCKNGQVKVTSFSYKKNLDQVIQSLMKGVPVVASIRLTPNFYQNKGLILESERNIGPSMDSHAQGHSVLLVGLVKLPESLNEGQYCFLTANSWGEGWAQGGHSCISENWLLQQRSPNPFVVVNHLQY